MLAFAVGDTLMGYNSGFDETNFSGSGFYLKAKMLERAEQQGFRNFNFLQGNERYKYELGGKDFFVYKADIDL
jgi:CelD/BcsL family acetyltransferase involved in cellulose biosynthesis